MAWIQQRKNGVYYLFWYDSNGRKKAKSLCVRSMTDKQRDRALVKYTETIRDAVTSHKEETKDPSLDAFWTAYWPVASVRKSENSIAMEEYTWGQFKQEFPVSRMGAVTRSDIEQFIARWTKAGKRPKTINNFLTLARAWYNAAIHLDLYDGTNPFTRVKKLAAPRSGVTSCTTEEREALLDAAESIGRDMHLYFALGFFAGLRKDEIGMAAWDWIDWEQNVIRIPANAQWQPKNGKTAVIPLASRLKDVLNRYRGDGYIVAPEIDRQNARYRYEGRDVFERVVSASGVKTKVTPHVLRHTFATELLKKGVSIAKIKEWCRHSSIQITVDTYGHLQGHDADIDRL